MLAFLTHTSATVESRLIVFGILSLACSRCMAACYTIKYVQLAGQNAFSAASRRKCAADQCL
jgi:hypothetical protein